MTRGSHRNDVSPLTQGLRYRAACDAGIDLVLSYYACTAYIYRYVGGSGRANKSR